MDKNTSIYLDIIRFFAACLVVIYHSSGVNITGGFLWQVSGYGKTAVMVFFVLSGYVIAFVANNKEKTLADFSIARFARLYSIIIPALFITFVCNQLGNIFIFENFQGSWNPPQENSYINYLASFFMLQNIWFTDLSPANNGSFWSLSYEFFYYALFAFIFYLNGFKRIIFVILLALMAGPKIIALAPIWLLGYFAYYLHNQWQHVLANKLAIFLFIAGSAILFLSPDLRNMANLKSNFISHTLWVDYIDGFAFFIHLLGIPLIASKLAFMLQKIQRPVLFISGLTFSIYLFHLPLIRLFAGISPFLNQIHSWQHIMFVYSTSFCVILLFAIPAEHSKKWYKKAAYLVINKIKHRDHKKLLQH